MNVKIEKFKDEVDFSKFQILKNKSCTQLVLTPEGEQDPSSDRFTAIDLGNGALGEYLKESFTLFNGTITLSND